MIPVDNPNNIFFRKVPVTPIMDTQLDRVVIQTILVPLKHKVLKLLQKTLARGHTSWFDIFAAVFILLNSIEIGMAHNHKFATFYSHMI